MFINCSNHKSIDWSAEQKSAAKAYGEIVDVGFPTVAATSNEAEISEIADGLFEKIKDYSPACVMCQGEFTLTYSLVKKLLDANIKTVAACSEREVEEVKLEDGSTQKKATFRFVGFREYR